MIPIEIVEMGHGVWCGGTTASLDSTMQIEQSKRTMILPKRDQTETNQRPLTKNTSKRTQLFPDREAQGP